MRVLCVEHKTMFGGGQIALLNVLREFQRARAGVECCIVCSPNAELGTRAHAYGIETISLELGAIEKTRGSAWNLAQRVVPTMRLLQVTQRSRPDAVLANGAFSFLASVFTAKLARVPIVWWEHNTTLPSDANLKRMIGWANHIVVVTNVIREQFIRLVPAAREKISVIYNGVEVARFYDQRESKNEKLREWGWHKNGRIVGTLSRLAPEKGVEYFIETAARIARARDDVNFLIVGDGVERARLEKQARELNLQSRVQFVGFQNDVENYLRVMDVVLFTSLQDAFPLVILEAMASARPVIATDVGGVREQIVNGETGMIVPARAVEAMTRAVLELLNDDIKARAFGERGRARVLEQFTLAEQAARMQELLAQVRHR